MRCVILCLCLATTGGCNLPESGTRSGPRTNPLFNRGAKEAWTIQCREFDQPQRRMVCEQVAETLRRVPEIRADAVSCQHDDGRGVSRLVYGVYERRVDPATHQRSTPPDLQRDLALIRNLGDDRGQPFFSGARIAPVIDTTSGPEQWDLANAPRGAYSLQIAVFFPELDFNEPRQAATEYVEHLREEGHEAFYHHDPHRSIVTVGLFEESSARLDPQTGQTVVSAEVRALQRNPLFQFNYENGQKRTKVVNGQRFPPYSFLVRIPGRG